MVTDAGGLDRPRAPLGSFSLGVEAEGSERLLKCTLGLHDLVCEFSAPRRDGRYLGDCLLPLVEPGEFLMENMQPFSQATGAFQVEGVHPALAGARDQDRARDLGEEDGVRVAA